MSFEHDILPLLAPIGGAVVAWLLATDASKRIVAKAEDKADTEAHEEHRRAVAKLQLGHAEITRRVDAIEAANATTAHDISSIKVEMAEVKTTLKAIERHLERLK